MVSLLSSTKSKTSHRIKQHLEKLFDAKKRDKGNASPGEGYYRGQIENMLSKESIAEEDCASEEQKPLSPDSLI